VRPVEATNLQTFYGLISTCHAKESYEFDEESAGGGSPPGRQTPPGYRGAGEIASNFVGFNCRAPGYDKMCRRRCQFQELKAAETRVWAH
jgi:hypothetical protein